MVSVRRSDCIDGFVLGVGTLQFVESYFCEFPVTSQQIYNIIFNRNRFPAKVILIRKVLGPDLDIQSRTRAGKESHHIVTLFNMK